MTSERDVQIAWIKERGLDTKMLEHAERQWVETGDMRFVLMAIYDCAIYETVIPEWAAKAFSSAYSNVTTRRAASWDDVFGKPLKKRGRLAAARRRCELEPKVYLAVNKILDEEPGTPIDVLLFERVGEQLGIGKTLVSELWAECPFVRRPR